MQSKPLSVCKLPAVALIAAMWLSACGTSTSLLQAHGHYLEGNTQAALQTLNNPDDLTSNDRLLYWLEKGMYHHHAGQFNESVRLLLQAADYLDSTDHISVSNEAKALIANDWAGTYRGEYSERLWIHSMLMMNFLLQERFESAAVEARKSLEIIEKHPDVLNNDHFTRALIGVSFEAAQQTNDAYIVNKKLALSLKQSPFSQFVERQAARLGFTGTTTTTNTQPQYAIIFIANGHIPLKFSGSLLLGRRSRVSFPQYRVPFDLPATVQIQVDGQPCQCNEISSDLGKLVASSLSKRAAALTTKAVLRVTARDAIAEAVTDEDKVAGELVRLLFFALEQADTRSWRSLPRQLSLVRVPINESSRELSITVDAARHVVRLPVFDERRPLLFIQLPTGGSH